MAETAIAAVLSKFSELAVNKANVQIRAREDMLLLHDRLECLQAFIRDADRKRRAGTDGLTRVWVRQARDVAFQAEDTLDEFFHENDQISENQRECNIEHTPFGALPSCTTAIEAWRGDDYTNSVGFEDDVQTLDKMLLDEAEDELMFISIVGESGVGKRTLGKVVSSKMKGKFDVLIRLTVPPEFTPQRLLKEIRRNIEEQLGGSCGGSGDESSSIRRLLSNKRYLLVLGGIGSKTMVDCLRASLPEKDNNGSRVMLTMDDENEEVAWHGNSMNRESLNGVHQLWRLHKEGSAELFRSRAFKKEESDGKEEGYMMMSKYDQVVFDITGGHPLAIVVLAGLLRFKERPGHWEAVLQQLSPASYGSVGGMEAVADGGEASKETLEQLHLSTRTTMERVLWASFEDLPNHLKSCFLYFAAFSKNIAQYANELVRMWIGEGFVKPHKGKTMEELGYGYLKELALRCLVDILQVVDGVITMVKIHPRLHGLLQSEAREAGFVEVHDTNDVLVPPSVRRLSFRSFDVTFTKKLPKLRSFICRVGESELGEDCPCDDLGFLCSSKFLRLIYVNGLKLGTLPDGIGGMTHLRYLYVRCKGLKELPSSIKWLVNLQTLDIRGTGVRKIDPGFWEIKTLRHVLADELTLPGALEGEEALEELQTLHGVKLAAAREEEEEEEEGGGDGWTQEDSLFPLRKMTKLRSLKLQGIDHHKHGAALETALKMMRLLVHLKLKGDVIPSCVFTGEGLQYLETVELDGTVQWPNVSPDLRVDRPNLSEITLTDQRRYDEELEKAGFVFSECQRAYRPSSKPTAHARA
uniref:Uncharacterized protein n=1 Tax=Avena sativa TaxID=4498 RepID=A0ACD5VAN7_AVESA